MIGHALRLLPPPVSAVALTAALTAIRPVALTSAALLVVLPVGLRLERGEIGGAVGRMSRVRYGGRRRDDEDVLEDARLGVDQRAQLRHESWLEALRELGVEAAQGDAEHLDHGQALRPTTFP